MIRLLTLIIFSFLLSTCGEKKESQPEPKPVTDTKVELKAVNYSDLKNWQNDNIRPAIDSFQKSCAKILQKKEPFLGNSIIRIPTAEYQEICQQLTLLSPQEAKSFIEKNLTPFLITANGRTEGKFTSYYESSLNASYTQDARYRYPIYGRPHDLIEFNPADFDDSLPSKRFVGRINNNKLIPYFSREDIEEKPLNAPVILWGDDAVDIYIMQIQGSAVATLPDGSTVRIAYADNNGHPFKGIGSILLSKGVLQPGQASMGQIKVWLKQNFSQARSHMLENERYIFHRLSEAEGPIGAQGVPLTSGRSLAVDNSFVPLGALMWLETTGPDKEDISRLVVAQDIGSAIKGPIRGDYFWGSGNDEILEKAGRMNSQGRYFIFLPKSTELTENGSQTR